MKTNNPSPAKECKKCGSTLTDGQVELSVGRSAAVEWCSDIACPYHDWPQAIDLHDLQDVPQAIIENKFGVKKRAHAEIQTKVNLCVLVQARIPVEAPANYAGMDEEELLEWGNTKLREMLSSGFRVGDFLSEDDSLGVSMIERQPLERTGCRACGTEVSVDEKGCQECGEPVPVETADYEVLVTTQEWEIFWANPDANTKIVHPGKDETG